MPRSYGVWVWTQVFLTRKFMFLPLYGQSVSIALGPDNQKFPTPWGMLYSVPCLACRSRDGLFWPVFLTFMRSTNIYWMLYCLPSSMQGPKDKIMSKDFNSYGPVETPPSSALPINFKRIVSWLLSPFRPMVVVFLSAVGTTVFLGTFYIYRVGHFEALSFECLNVTFP